MKRFLGALVTGIAFCGPTLADCFDQTTFFGTGQIKTKGGGTYSYGISVGGEATMQGSLEGRPGGLPDMDFDLQTGYDIGFADAGLARLLAPKATAAEAEGTRLFVIFAANGALPDAKPGTGWKGKVSATVYAMAADDYNRRAIGEALLEGTYTFPDAIKATISGCTYLIQPTELTLTWQGKVALKRRVLYFPDLGVSAITKWGPDAEGPERTTGITGFAIPD